MRKKQTTNLGKVVATPSTELKVRLTTNTNTNANTVKELISWGLIIIYEASNKSNMLSETY